MAITYKNTVSETVAEDFRAATVFSKYGIDYCCKGNISIDEACERKNILTEDVMRDLKKSLASDSEKPVDFKSWKLSDLADYIENTHHQFIRERVPVIRQHLDKLVHVHGGRHPELHDVRRLFYESTDELDLHMRKEEQILFPRIRQLSMLQNGLPENGSWVPGMIMAPIRVMMAEHETEGDRFQQIDTLTGHYQPPADACNTYRVTFALLQEFENDLHLHIHLENNILFPGAMDMENEMLN